LGLGLLADFLQDIRGVLGHPDQGDAGLQKDPHPDGVKEKAQRRQDHQAQKALAEASQAPAQGDGVENPREPEGDKAAKAQVKKGLKEALNAYMFPWFQGIFLVLLC
jgi:hypothetical protein